MHRYYRHHLIKKKGQSRESVDKIKVLKFSDLLCCSIRIWPRKRSALSLDNPSDTGLERIRDKDGNTTQEPTAKQRQVGRNVGTSVVRACYICRGYLDPTGEPISNQTQWWCAACHMPICAVDRKEDTKFGPNGRDPPMTCLEVHQTTTSDGAFGCGRVYGQKEKFPKEYQINLHPRRSQRHGR